ncbi:hypothetical protein MCOR02_009468 [Pyricularia oryzae]|nr:hypothetical protein MCOR02_009468 [Pyricularia oryzae]KAI6324585.1 hypothetical protein MCOR34_001440 [Pyricularia oryzae]KAI6327202.1 hypothetical protein MCOR29_003156 [Pyricularia oryzae]KAI6331365.1 hypothetical protein MCOR30_004864 [Pyricularia oryzae]KAI6348112.1 hypothetical protein MCOR28_001893 [Pyricularia oryzae]
MQRKAGQLKQPTVPSDEGLRQEEVRYAGTLPVCHQPANVSEADFQDIGSDNELQNPAHTPPKWNDLSTVNCTILWCLRWLPPGGFFTNRRAWRGSSQTGEEWDPLNKDQAQNGVYPPWGTSGLTVFLFPAQQPARGGKRRRLRPARQGVQPLGACLDRSGGLANSSTQRPPGFAQAPASPARKPPNLPNRFAPLPKNLQNGHVPLWSRSNSESNCSNC